MKGKMIISLKQINEDIKKYNDYIGPDYQIRTLTVTRDYFKKRIFKEMFGYDILQNITTGEIKIKFEKNKKSKKESLIMKMSAKEIMDDYLWKPINGNYDFRRICGYDTCLKKYLYNNIQWVSKEEMIKDFEYIKIDKIKE